MGEEGQPVPNIGAKPSITYSDPYVVDGVLVQKDSLGKIKRLGEIKTPKKQWAPPREFKPGSGIYIQTDPEDGRTYRVFSEGEPADITGLNRAQTIYKKNYDNARYEIRDLEKAMNTIRGNVISKDLLPIIEEKLKDLQALLEDAQKRATVAKTSFVAVGGDPAMLGEEANKVIQPIPPGQPTGAQSPGGSQDYDWRDYQ